MAVIAVPWACSSQARNGGPEIAAEGLFGAGFAADGVAPQLPGLVEQVDRHRQSGLYTRRLVGQRDGYDQRRSPPTEPDHPRIAARR